MSKKVGLTDNYILKALPENESKLISSALEAITLEVGDIINHPYEAITYVYFPNNSMISVIASTPQGQLSEVGVVGQEGVLGVGVLMGTDSTPHENIVQLPGTAYRMPTNIFREMFEKCSVLRKLILRFTYAHMMQISQTALCNCFHQVEQRLARWILMSHDRSETDLLPLTQDLLAIMLGTSRPTVSISAAKLKDDGYIKYVRGKITVLDRKGLEDFCCDCYSLVRDEYERVLH